MRVQKKQMNEMKPLASKGFRKGVCLCVFILTAWNVAVAVRGMCQTACFAFPHKQLPLIAFLIPPMSIISKVIKSV